MSCDQTEDAVAALDELASNALRHGRGPVHVEVCALEVSYLLLVNDHAPHTAPRPTSVRDPARGGMGLGIVASTARSCGWFTDGVTKTVWADMPGEPSTPTVGP